MATDFIDRHIGPKDSAISEMLKALGLKSLEDLADKVVPANIRTKHDFAHLGEGLSEYEMLERMKNVMSKNQVFRSLIGMGFYDTITPTVIQRNILENPLWYTAYTPYQPEISQGRLEALLNFQTMVMDLTKMEIANASLLDEGTAAAEAMAMAASLAKNKSTKLLVSDQLHPHVIEVLRTRAEPLKFELVFGRPESFDYSQPHFGIILAYPNSDGSVVDPTEFIRKTKSQGGLAIVTSDLLALTMLKPPGEMDADIVVGNTQRFGVPLGNGGPHAAFIATKDAYKRLMPGRLVGVSIDSRGQRALRLTLQTREQHIRREKATSNICTAQVLLANMASMYAVYHGPQGLTRIAEKVHDLTKTLATGLVRLGYKVATTHYFDTLTVHTDKAEVVARNARSLGINLRVDQKNQLGISLDETCDTRIVEQALKAFNDLKNLPFSLKELHSTARALPGNVVRQSPFLTHPVFNTHHSETELLRYITSLQNKDLTLASAMIPLGSCTMKLNATTELVPVSWPEVNRIHPFAPTEQMQGYLEMIKDLESKLCEITGFSAVSLQPNAGSQGEYAGLLVIRKYHQSRGEGHRNICLIPSSAHGTNPASAVMAGMDVVVVQCDEQGNVDVNDLRQKSELHSKNLAALMVTYPSTHGVFESSIREICDIIHKHGGQVYMDGANLNALVGVCRPGEFGPDVSHMNLHKTFAIPHGGGGPGIGPIGVAPHLVPFLPTHGLKPEAGPQTGITSTTSAPWGSASILPISWSYISMMGASGLKKATLVSILSANYIARRLSSYYPVLYKGQNDLVAHECILDLRHLKRTANVDVTDVAKRLMDYGFHAPTMSWPVAGTLMVEPTESESKTEVDRFCDAMISIRKEIENIETAKFDAENNPLKNAPHTMQEVVSTEWTRPYSRELAAFPSNQVRANKYWPAVARVDNAYGDRHVVCSCPPIEEYSSGSQMTM